MSIKAFFPEKYVKSVGKIAERKRILIETKIDDFLEANISLVVAV